MGNRTRKRPWRTAGVEPLEVRALLTQFADIATVGAMGLDTQAARFGSSLDIDGDTAVIGAPGGMGTTVRSGFAAVYHRDDAGTPADPMDDRWDYVTQLTPTSESPRLGFGISVAVQGNTIAVGAPAETGGEGRVFLFQSGSDGWGQVAALRGPDGQSNESFGSVVRLGTDVLAVGAPLSGAAGPATGAVDIFTPTGGSWTHQRRLTHPAASIGDAFGSDLAIAGDRILVGAPFDDAVSVNDGSVTEFRRVDERWQYTGLILSPAASAGGSFGTAIAINGSRLVVGAPGESTGGVRAAGAAYEFTNGRAGWQVSQVLQSGTETEGVRFGSSVAATGERLLVGLSGTRTGDVAEYHSTDAGWQRDGLLSTGSRNGDRFGFAIAVSGSFALVGSPRFDGGAADTGAVRSLAAGAARWQALPTARILAPSVFGDYVAAGDSAGAAVATDGETLVIGVPERDRNRLANAGQALVFERSDSGTPADPIDDTWTFVAALSPLSVGGHDRFGSAVAVSRNTIAISAPNDRAGSVYVFRRESGVWAEHQKIRGTTSRSRDSFGASLALSGGVLAVGAPTAGAGQNNEVGRVWLYRDLGSSFLEEAQLTAESPQVGSRFGHSVALSGSELAIGAPYHTGPRGDEGVVETYLSGPVAWERIQRLHGPSLTGGSRFGESVALQGLTLAVGAPGIDSAVVDSGAVLRFARRPDTEWTAAQTILPPAPVAGGQFGAGLALDSSQLLVGSDGRADLLLAEDDEYVFRQELVPNEDTEDAGFAGSVAMTADVIAIGSPRSSSVAELGGQTTVFHRVTAPEVSVSDAAAGEDSGAIRFTITRSHVRGDAQVTVRTVARSATAGVDFKPLTRTVVDLPNGGPASTVVAVPLLQDNLLEPPETLRLEILDSVFASVGDSVGRGEIRDDDEAGFRIFESDGATLVIEGSASDQLTVRLTARPLREVQLRVAIDTTEAVIDKSRLIFHPGDWDVPQTVAVTAVDDDEDDGTQSGNIALTVDRATSDAAFADVPSQSVPVRIFDNDTADFILSATDGVTQVSESGDTDELEVVLAARPTSDVIVNVAADGELASVSPASLRFTPATWATPQRVTIQAVDDSVDTGDRRTDAIFSIGQGSDRAFAELPAKSATVLVLDDDIAGISISQTGGSTQVSETGSRDRLTVRLTSQPTGTVSVALTSTDRTEARLNVPRVTFDAQNWSTPRRVVVRGIDDAKIDGPQDVTITARVEADFTTAAEYTGVQAGIVATNADYEVDYGFGDSALVADPARHLITSGLRLGNRINSESAPATEAREANDGVRFPKPLEAGARATAIIKVGSDATNAVVSAWIDFNHDGDWDDFAEQIVRNKSVEPGRNTATFRVPVSIAGGPALARFRISTARNLSPGGEAPDGEIEDYLVTLRQAPRAVSDAFSVNDKATLLDVLQNDVSTSPLELRRVSSSDVGKTEIRDNQIQFDADTGFTGETTLSYGARGAELVLESNRFRAGLRYGASVAVDGDFAVVGVPGAGGDAGAADIYRRRSSGWVFQQRVVATSRLKGAEFGTSVSISAGTIAVGASARGRGTVSIFTFEDGVWNPDATLQPDERGPSEFGRSVALGDGRLAVGAPRATNGEFDSGAVFVFERQEAGTWQQTERLTGSHTNGTDQFGAAVAVNRDFLVVGAPKDDIRGMNSGAAYVFTRNRANRWTQSERLAPLELQEADHFGYSVSLSGQSLAIGAPLDDRAAENAGAVWLFAFDTTSNAFLPEQVVVPQTPIARARFGQSVSLDDSSLLVASLYNDARPVLFRREDSTWKQRRVFINPGSAVAISADMAVFGMQESSLFARNGGSLAAADTRELTGRVTIQVTE